MIMNTAIERFLLQFEASILVIHILGFFAILLPLAVSGSHQSASGVFKTFLKTGNGPTQGISVMVELIENVYNFTGTLHGNSPEI